MVISEKMVDIDTIFTERAVSLSNFAENIVVTAAVGAAQEITNDTSKLPRIPQRYIPPKDNKGNKISFKNRAKTHFKSRIPFMT